VPVIKHILFPVDYSPRCLATVPFVSDFVRRMSANLTVLQVVLPPTMVYPVDTAWPVTGPDLENLREIGQNRVRAFSQEYFQSESAQGKVEALCELGDPATVIRDFAEDHSIDLIMMPTHGQGRFRSLLLGSVTAKVLHDAKCSVWTSAHLEERGAFEAQPLQNILCAVDLNNESVSVLRYAKELGELYNARVHVLHAVPAPEGPFQRYFNSEHSAEVVQSSLQELKRLQNLAGTSFGASVQAGNTPQIIRSAAERLRAGLVIIGRGSIHSPLRGLWTNVHAVVRESPCPVLTV
jgi:nucleotide-binding universal stress UspA family protein